MFNNNKAVAVNSPFLLPLTLLNAILIKYSFTDNAQWGWLLVFTIPLLFLSIRNTRKRRSKNSGNKSLLRQVRYSFEPADEERLSKRRSRTAYIRYRVFNKGGGA